MEILGSALCSLVGQHVNQHHSLGENMDKLKRKFAELNNRKEDVIARMEHQKGKKLKKEVRTWLDNVQRVNNELESIESKVGEGNCFSRASLGKLVTKKIEEVEQLYQKGSFSDGLVIDALPQIGEILPTGALVGETTAKRNMEEVWASLISDDVRKIGVYGTVGIGKTTLIKHVNNRVLEETDLFDDVIWITASSILTVVELQDAVAGALSLDLSKCKDVTMRAGKLFSMLKEKTRYVLILDDMWEAFDLDHVGIPQPCLANGCKLVLTTCSLDVCRSMGCKDIRVELLSKEEAWNLFLDTVGRDVLLCPSLEATVKLIAQECACLPHAITVVARAMKGVVDICEWRNTLEELRGSTKGFNDTTSKVLDKFKLSFSRLNNEELHNCLVYCALYPKDFKIERKELIELLIAEGVIEGMKSRQAEFCKGRTMLNKLENACLLDSVIDNKNKKCVTMHRLIRSTILQMASANQRFIVEAGAELKHLPKEGKWTEDLEKVSLMDNCISDIPPPILPRCYRLSTLLLSRNSCLKGIHSHFFVHFLALQVLNLSYTVIENLPDSLSNLGNLTALLLRRCTQLRHVPSLANLTALRRLDLAYTRIKEVPEGMESLINLRYLNLYMPLLKILPIGLLSKFSHLQYLIIKWTSETLRIRGEEVAGLKKLETFAGQFYDLHDFNMFVKSLQEPGLDRYLFRVGPKEPFVLFEDDEEEKYFSKDVD